MAFFEMVGGALENETLKSYVASCVVFNIWVIFIGMVSIEVLQRKRKIYAQNFETLEAMLANSSRTRKPRVFRTNIAEFLGVPKGPHIHAFETVSTKDLPAFRRRVQEVRIYY